MLESIFDIPLVIAGLAIAGCKVDRSSSRKCDVVYCGLLPFETH